MTALATTRGEGLNFPIVKGPKNYFVGPCYKAKICLLQNLHHYGKQNHKLTILVGHEKRFQDSKIFSVFTHESYIDDIKIKTIQICFILMRELEDDLNCSFEHISSFFTTAGRQQQQQKYQVTSSNTNIIYMYLQKVVFLLSIVRKEKRCKIAHLSSPITKR